MGARLNLPLATLLNRVISTRGVSVDISCTGEIPTLTAEQREVLTDALIAELAERGLDKDDEPNEIGIQIEQLIDYVNSAI